LKEVGLEQYGNPERFISFIGYLMARSVSRAQLTKQVAVARKVNHFMRKAWSSGSPYPLEVLDSWFNTLSSQLHANIPDREGPCLPPHLAITRWSKGLAGAALEEVAMDMKTTGSLSHGTAIKVGAIIIIIINKIPISSSFMILIYCLSEVTP
jgi:hypothetical protein